MNKTLLFTAFALALLLIGCAQQQADNVKVVSGEEMEADKEIEEAEEETTETEEETEDEMESEEESGVEGITQEDLDKLKADIEGLESEDLGGLSE